MAAPPSSLAARFAAAVQLVRETPASAVRLGDEQRLALYGLFKQATEGDNGSKQPGLLDFVGRSKWNAWKALASVEAAEAMQRYVDSVAQWFPSPPPGNDASASSASAAAAAREGSPSAAASGGGGGGEELSFGSATVGSMGAIGLDGRVIEAAGVGGKEEDGEEPRDVFYFAKRGLVDEVRTLLEGGGEGSLSVNAQDEECRSLLHWAVDGGHAGLVEELLKRGADAGLKDSQGDTALDYAKLCEYTELAARLREAATGTGR